MADLTPVLLGRNTASDITIEVDLSEYARSFAGYSVCILTSMLRGFAVYSLRSGECAVIYVLHTRETASVWFAKAVNTGNTRNGIRICVQARLCA